MLQCWILTCFSVGVLLLHGQAQTVPTAAPVPPVEATDFIRFVETDEGDSLQTALVEYVNDRCISVDLIGAVHIADRRYFEALNARFKTYEAVLYELVGRPVEQRQTLKSGDGSDKLRWLGVMQEKMRQTLKLESQLQCIDYKAPNFVHADLSTEGFFATQAEKKETFLNLWMKAALAKAATSDSQQPASDLSLIMTLMISQDSATDLKRLIGKEFDRVEQLMAGIESGDGTAIIGSRNQHALEILQKQMAAGRKRLGIFYGAAHFPDMEQRLISMGFKKRRVEWLKAWDIDADE